MQRVYGIKVLIMYRAFGVKTPNAHVKRTSPRSVVAKKMYEQISSVHGSGFLTVRWNPMGNWAISTVSGQMPCTRIVVSILQSFFSFSKT